MLPHSTLLQTTTETQTTHNLLHAHRAYPAVCPTHSYLKCAEKLYTALRKNGELRSVLEKFEELYGEAAERLSLAMLDMADGKFAEAAERLAILTKEDTQQREYYTALSLRPICLMRMDKPGWKNEMREAAEKLDAAADDPDKYMDGLKAEEKKD